MGGVRILKPCGVSVTVASPGGGRCAEDGAGPSCAMAAVASPKAAATLANKARRAGEIVPTWSSTSFVIATPLLRSCSVCDSFLARPDILCTYRQDLHARRAFDFPRRD